MLLSALEPASAWAFGPGFQRPSLTTLDPQGMLAGTLGPEQRPMFSGHRERRFRAAMLPGLRKWIADDAPDVLMWLFLGILIGVSWVFDLWLLADETALGGAAAFLINAGALANPLGDTGRVCTKWREA